MFTLCTLAMINRVYVMIFFFFSPQEDVQELSRRLTTIDCQLKKSELNRKHLEITNKKLLGFAQVPL